MAARSHDQDTLFFDGPADNPKLEDSGNAGSGANKSAQLQASKGITSLEHTDKRERPHSNGARGLDVNKVIGEHEPLPCYHLMVAIDRGDHGATASLLPDRPSALQVPYDVA